MITDEIGGGGGGAGISGSALANLLTGYATQDWVGENYISIEFFSRLFQAHGTENGVQTDIDPNDTTTTITSIESMFGFWTDYYLSALGNGGGLGSTLYLSTLADVLISSPSNNQVLTYNATLGKWVNANATGGALSTLSDVTLGTPSYGDVLLYDGTKWINSALKTINSQSLIGSGDISVGGGASGNYLPLTGGTLVGTLNIVPSVVQINFRPNYSGYNSKIKYMTYGHEALVFGCVNSETSYIFKCGLDITDTSNDWTGITPSLQIKKQSVYINQLIGDNETPSYNFLVNGTANITSSLIVSGLNFEYNNEINCSYNSMHLNYRQSGYISLCNGGGYVGIRKVNPSYDLDVNGTIGTNNISIASGGRINLQGEATSYLYIGNANNHGWVALQDVCSSNGYQYWQITIRGDAKFANVQSNGYVTALSDIRKKDVLSTDIGLTVEQIADAPTIKFFWKDRRNEGIQVGSVAQFWGAYLPEVVMDKGGELSMQYGVTALVSAIITARKVVDHERRIQALENKERRIV